jgi:uncharacterized protein (DUF2141 family)
MKDLPFRMLGAVLVAIGISVSASDSIADTTDLKIELTGLEDVQGNLYIAVYDSDVTWLGKETVMEKQVIIADARKGELVSTVLQLPPGEYALSIFYDSNDNGKLDTNFLGIPKEPIALSNNARAKFGPPKYKDAVFSLGEEALTQRISMEKI